MSSKLMFQFQLQYISKWMTRLLDKLLSHGVVHMTIQQGVCMFLLQCTGTFASTL